jgi:hypothetical protein
MVGRGSTVRGMLRVRRELEAAGRKVPISFEPRVRELDGELEVEATTPVDHRLFGMTWSPLGMLRSPTTLHVKARLTSIAPERRSRPPPANGCRSALRRQPPRPGTHRGRPPIVRSNTGGDDDGASGHC